MERPRNHSKWTVERIKNKITIHSMSTGRTISDFIKAIKNGLDEGCTSFSVFVKCDRIYASVGVPIAAIMDHYRTTQSIGFSVHTKPGSYERQCGIGFPLLKNSNDIQRERSPFDKIYKYEESSQVAALTQAFVDSISQFEQCGEGILKTLIWCINETMDNVLVHSKNKFGYIMGQYHPNVHDVIFCIYDSGIGIYNAFKGSKHSPKSPLDAISLAIQEGVGDGMGQGNGLYGLSEAVNQNGGYLSITSGTALIHFLPDGSMKKFENIETISHLSNSTCVNFRLNLKREVDIQQIFNPIGGFEGFDIRLDNMLQDDDNLLYNVFDNCKGTATREAGRLVRNDVYNTLARTKCPIILDFTGVKTVSSSFIDEFLAKLVLDLGFFAYNQFIKLRGMNKDIQLLAERSFRMRIHESWENRNQI